MTATLRIVNVQINSSTSIDVSFTENLTGNLVAPNASIISETLNVPDSEVLEVTVTGNVFTITCQPLTPFATYYLQLQSTPSNPFQSLNGDAKISEDGVSNRYFFNGPADLSNPVREYLGAFYKDNIYNLDDSNNVVAKYIQSISANFARALYDIRQVKNENYLSFTVGDELQVRGEGPFDRLNEEAAYDIFRVGRGPTKSLASTSFTSDTFPSYPVTLQRKLATEIVKASSDDQTGTFNINTLTFNLSNHPVTRVNSIVFTFTTVNPVFNYDISTLGYQILDSRYDQDFASSYLLLEDNQIKINEKVLQDPNFVLDKLFSINIQYEYKNLGIQVDTSTVNVYTTLQSIREVLPPIINIFNLKHAPVTNASNGTPVSGGVTFMDPNSNTGSPHPAFITEIPFRLNALPSVPGVYSVDYSTGTVYVYGADSNNDGTGPSPPLATYYYKFTYTSEIDYVFDSDLLDIVALPNGNLVDSTGTVNFSFEEVFIPGVDYVADSHIESLNERIGNRLLALNSLRTLNSPITNVFQIFNETSGEIYTLDRWNDNKVYFRYNSPPRILSQTGETATFETVTNELLSVDHTITNISSARIFVIFLANNTIISSTQDGIASSINTSLVFTNGNVFISEKWYDQELAVSSNVDRLTSVGQYMVDYANGIIYLSVSSTQDFNLGTAIYKKDSISPKFPHVVSVDDIYYRISVLNPKNKTFKYISFTDGSIVPEDLDPTDEAFLNESKGAPYQLFMGMVGAFVNSTFVPGVTNSIKFLRSVYEYNDLLNSTHPLNFAQSSVSNNFNITVNAINKQSFENVQFDGVNHFININENIPYLSPGITYTFSVVRVSDSQVLWNNSGTVVPGNPLKLILPGINSPQTGDFVNVTYSFTILPIERVIVDYNKGDFFIDYTYVADEILVSYEYGDNVIDFRKNRNLPAGTQYYVSYKVGALRDALLKNFGTLVNVEDLSTFDLTLNRERYREALQAALSSFVQGPTVAAIKNIGQIISHIEPDIIESAFEAWALGRSLLFPVGVKTTGSFSLLPAHFGNGVLVNNPSQTITLPANSNLRLEEGTFETWILPQWNGLDNDANLTFTITRDGYAIDPYRVFIGASEYHPEIINGSFMLNKLSSVSGKPNTNKDGVFIYYDKDRSGSFQRWYVEIIDGYVTPGTPTYKLKIVTNGKYYDMKPISPIKPSNMSTFTGLNTFNMTITGGSLGVDEGITFLADLEHYILDLGADKDDSRLSIFKDVSGYLNFRVYDRDHLSYSVSADVSAWRLNEPHMIAASWKLNTRNERDEMHLFIDGLEVPNIIKYGQKLRPYLHEKFRTVDPEEIVGLAARDIVGSNDLVTTIGTNTVTSSINFSTFQIFIGDTIFIDEVGFSTIGYTITNINGQTLTLSSVMPRSLSNARFSINRTQYLITSDIDVVPNIAVSTIHTFVTGNDLTTVMGSNIVTSTGTNFTTANVLPGYLLRIDNPSFELTYNIVQVSGNSLTITDFAPVNLSNATFQIYSNTEHEIPGKRALQPAYSISKDVNFNNILTISNDVFANDLVLVRTLGLNHRGVKKQCYVWSTGQENILMTSLPAPISLDEAKITKIITPVTAIGPANSTYGSGLFTSNFLNTAQPSNSEIGRTIQVTISGTNTDFSTPVQVTINGVTGINTVNETITFTNYGTLDFVNPYISLNSVQVIVKPLNPLKNALNIDVREKFSITHSEFSGLVPVVRYSYHIGGGYTLGADGYDNMVTDPNNVFSALDIGNYLVIHSPITVAGFYKIVTLSTDRHSVGIQSTVASFAVPLPKFSNGIYQVLNTNAYRSGLQNGFFTFEAGTLPSQAYFLSQGFYELAYSTYTRIKFKPLNGKLYVGSDLDGHNQANAIIDQATIYYNMLTDTRIGEIISSRQRSVTKDFNSFREPKVDSNTLVRLEFDTFPFTNSAKVYANTNSDHKHFQSDWAVNDNFGQSTVILDEPVIVPNDGILDVRKQGTIEFWMSPLYDTANDPQERYYFDASSAIIEEATSVNSVSVKVSTPASKILKVVLAAGDPNIDYFVGGKLEIDTQAAVQEQEISNGDSSVTVTNAILQVITVKIAGDLTDIDYFANGTIGPDLKTIFLGKTLPANNLLLIVTYRPIAQKNNSLNTQVIRLNRKLPAQNSKVLVTYIPKGVQGDRMSIFKDKAGYINFTINASGDDFTVRAPTRWAKNTWHRVKATYKINSGIGTDEMRLYLDGYHYTDVTFGDNLVFGKFPTVMGAVTVGDGYGLIGNISFKDPINELFIGTDFTKSKPIFTLVDNFRISNLSRPIYAPYGEPIDVNYSTNLDIVFPVTQDLYTTYLMDFDKSIELSTSFSTLINRNTGGFDFTVNIFDSFGIISSSAKVKEILENLINILKPANSRVFIKYIT